MVRVARMGKKAQGSTEYLIIFAVVLLISLVVISYMASFFARSGQINEAESRLYWSSAARPIRVLAATSVLGSICETEGAGGYEFLVQNAEPVDVSIKSITINGVEKQFCVAGTAAAASVSLSPSAKAMLAIATHSNSSPCNPGDSVSADVSFVYSSSGLAERAQEGAKQLVFQCTNSAPSIYQPLGGGAMTGNNTTNVSVTTSFLSNGYKGTYYSASLFASGGDTPYSWTATNLPPGLGVAGSSIVGIPTDAGAYSVTIKVTDKNGKTNSKDVSLTIHLTSPLTITTRYLLDATVGAAYFAELEATGGTPPYTWDATGLPEGLVVKSSSIIGTPGEMAEGIYDVTIYAYDSTYGGSGPDIEVGGETSPNQAKKEFKLTVLPSGSELTILTTNLTDAYLYEAYTATLEGTGGTQPYSWYVDNLPNGLALKEDTIYGTPAEGTSGDYELKVILTDAKEGTITSPVYLKVNGLTITTSSLPDAYEDEAYAQSLEAKGGVEPYKWEVDGLPDGLELVESSIIGTPKIGTGGKNYTLKVTVYASDGETIATELVLEVQPKTEELRITASSLSVGIEGVKYSDTLSATGGTPPYTWKSSELPKSIILSEGGMISGTPDAGTSESSPYRITFNVVDAKEAVAETALDLYIAAPLEITTSSLPGAQVGEFYSTQLASSGGYGTITWSVDPPIDGLGLISASYWYYQGTPAEGTYGDYELTFSAEDSLGQADSQSISFTISPAPLLIVTSSLADAVEGEAYSAALESSGGVGKITWSVDPEVKGLSLTDTGSGWIYSGTPDKGTAGSYGLAFTVTDEASATDDQKITFTIK